MPIIPALSEISPCPFPPPFVDTIQDGFGGEVQQRSGTIFFELFGSGAEWEVLPTHDTTLVLCSLKDVNDRVTVKHYLSIPNVDVVHVHQGDGISVLVIVQQNANLIE